MAALTFFILRCTVTLRMNAFEILFEDRYIIAVNKHCGELVQPDRSGSESLSFSLASYVSERDCLKLPFLGVVHRLDRPVSGAVLFAKTEGALRAFSSLFQTREVQKTYWAVTDASPPESAGSLTHFIRTDKRIGKSFAFDDATEGSKEAILDYRVAGKSEHYVFLEIEIRTGRQHQIRAQLAKIGCHVKGDVKYGARRTNPGGGIHLHSRSIVLRHPITGEELSIVAPPPHDPLWDAFLRCMEIN